MKADFKKITFILLTSFLINFFLGCGSAKAGPAVIFSGADVKTLKQNISLNGFVKILSGTDDPTVVAKDAVKGSIYLRYGGSGGLVYTKQDNGLTTNWTSLSGGGGGGSAYTAHGNSSSPITITAAGGLSPNSDALQIWYVKATTSAGRMTVTANPQLAAGTTVGQHVEIVVVNSTDYPVFSDGTGLSLNGVWPSVSGPILNATIGLEWTGTIWSESFRR